MLALIVVLVQVFVQLRLSHRLNRFHKDDKLRLAINVAGLCCFDERDGVIGVGCRDDNHSLAIRDGGGREYGDMMAGN